MKRRRFLAGTFLLLASKAPAAGIYPEVRRDMPLRFPRDHGSHPAFRTEWWYVTGWVVDEGGNGYGIQVTFFRNRPGLAESNSSQFAPRQLLFAHAALADPSLRRLQHDQRAARAGFGLAEADENTTNVWIDDWVFRLADTGYHAHVAAHDFAFDLDFAPTQQVLPQGDAGYSRKGPLPVQASHYYSQPHLRVSGTIFRKGERTSVTGEAWLDHEWSSEYLALDAAGWDWASVNLADGGALMAFRIRGRSGAVVWAGATQRAADGRVRVYSPLEVRFVPVRTWRSPRTGIEYPVAMTLSLGDSEWSLEPVMEDQELDARASTETIYWEGAVRALVEERETGRGYLELTGYGKPLTL